MSTNTTQWPSLYQPQLKRAWRSLSLEFQLTYLSQFIFYSLHLAYYSATMLKNLCFGFQLQLNLEISRMVSFQLLLNSQQGPHFRTNTKIFFYTARLNSVTECFKLNDGCIDWEIGIMRRSFGTERVYFYFWLLDGNQSTSDIHSAWAACIYRTTGRHGYHSANRWSYNYNTSLPGSSPASSLCSTASSCELYFEKRLWSQIRMNALVMKFYCLSCGRVTFKFAVSKLIKLKLSKMYIKWERWSVLGWVKKRKMFFWSCHNCGTKKKIFFFLLDFVL